MTIARKTNSLGALAGLLASPLSAGSAAAESDNQAPANENAAVHQGAVVKWHPQQESAGNTGEVEGAWANLTRHNGGVAIGGAVHGQGPSLVFLQGPLAMATSTGTGCRYRWLLAAPSPRMAELAAAGKLPAAARAFAGWPFNEEEIAVAEQAGYFDAAGCYAPKLLILLQL